MTTPRIQGFVAPNAVSDGVVERDREPESSSERAVAHPDVPHQSAQQKHMSCWQRIKQKDRVLDGYLSTAASLASALLSYLGGYLLSDDKVPTIISALLWIGFLIMWIPAFYLCFTSGVPGQLSRVKKSWVLLLTIVLGFTDASRVSSKTLAAGIAGIISLSTMAVHCLFILVSAGIERIIYISTMAAQTLLLMLSNSAGDHGDLIEQEEGHLLPR